MVLVATEYSCRLDVSARSAGSGTQTHRAHTNQTLGLGGRPLLVHCLALVLQEVSLERERMCEGEIEPRGREGGTYLACACSAMTLAIDFTEG